MANEKNPIMGQAVRKEKKKIQRFPGDFENFTKSKEFKDSKKAQKDKYEKDKQHPVKGQHAAFDRLVNAGKKEVEAFKTYRKNRADTQDKARVQNMAKGGRAMLRGGGICKKGMNKKAIGKNS